MFPVSVDVGLRRRRQIRRLGRSRIPRYRLWNFDAISVSGISRCRDIVDLCFQFHISSSITWPELIVRKNNKILCLQKEKQKINK
jgi:L-alanine-DL-glutamate epimerase-like enolase superfamily enzyme